MATNNDSKNNEDYVLLNATIMVAKDANGTVESVPLTNALLNITTQVSSIPYLCTTKQIDVTKLAALQYESRVQKFFDPAKLTTYLLPTTNNQFSIKEGDYINCLLDNQMYAGTIETVNPDGTYNVSVEISDGQTETRSNIVRTNIYSANNRSIMVYNLTNMLVLLFPTSIPIMNNVVFSSKLQMPPVVHWLDMAQLAPSNIAYSYLHRNGQINTVTQTVWVNDVRNNPRYIALQSQFNSFANWRSRLLGNIKETNSEAIKLMEQIKDTMKTPTTIWDTLISEFDKQDPKDFAQAQHDEFVNAIKDIKNSLNTDTEKDMLTVINQLLMAVRRIRDLEVTVSGSSDNSGRTYSQIYTRLRQGIQKLNRYLKQYSIVDKQVMAVRAVTEINIQYTSNTDMASYLPTVYPQFTQFVDGIKAFHSSTYIENDLWRILLDTLVQSSTNNDAVFAKLLGLASKNGFTQWVGFDSPKIEKAGTNVRTVNVDLRMNIIDGRIHPNNVGDIWCAFQNMHLGSMYSKLRMNSNFDWRLPSIGYFSAVDILQKAEADKKAKLQEKEANKTKNATPATIDKAPTDKATTDKATTTPPNKTLKTEAKKQGGYRLNKTNHIAKQKKVK